MTELHAPLMRKDTKELEWWASLWGDLLLVQMTLSRREDRKGDDAMFSERALWEAALAAYGRTVKNGRRQVALKPLIEKHLDAAAQGALKEAMRWRDKHVAHRHAEDLERVSAALVVVPEHKAVTGIEVRVSTFAPSANLVIEFTRAITELRDIVWQHGMIPAEQAILDRLAADPARLERLCETARSPAPQDPAARTITFRPTRPPLL